MNDAPLDTPLARLLHQRGRLPLETLRGALEEVRAQRGSDASLAQTLVRQGHLGAAEAERFLGELVPAWQPGSVIAGGYRVVRRLGQGGMGAVDEVVELRTGARRAMKSLTLTTDTELRLRFQREGEALARVDGHPGVVRIHAAGQDQGRLWLLMDVEEGGDLARRLEAGPLPVDEVVALGVALAGGLGHVHRHGVLHRDLKPQNVLFDAAGRPKLTDFGVARTADARSLTQTGELLGTPAYMAPEQARGDVAGQDERTDVYGLAAVLYHALTGSPPFTGSTLEVLEQVLRGSPAPARRRRPDCPAWLERVILRALARAPGERYRSAAALEQALRTRGRADSGKGRRRGIAIGAAAAVVGGALLAAEGPWRRAPDSGAPAAVRSAMDAEEVAAGAPQAPVTSVGPVVRRVTPEEALERARRAATLTPEPPEWVQDQGDIFRYRELWRAPYGPADSLVLAEHLLFDRRWGRLPEPAAPLAGAAWLARVIDAPDETSERSTRARAWGLLGRVYARGRGLELDEAAARACYERGIELGSCVALQELAWAWASGSLGLARDPQIAFDLAERVLVEARPDDEGTWRACAELQAQLLWDVRRLRDPERLRRGRERLERVLRLNSDRELPGDWLGVARLAELEGQWAHARSAYRHVVDTAVNPAERAASLFDLWRLCRSDGADPAPVRARLQELAREGDRPAARMLGRLLAESGELDAAAAQLLVAAAPGTPGGGATEVCARLELGRLVRDTIARGALPPCPLPPVLLGLRQTASAGNDEAPGLCAWLEGVVDADRELLDRLAAQTGPAPPWPPDWLAPEVRQEWPKGGPPDLSMLTLGHLLAFQKMVDPRFREEGQRIGMALLVQVAREAADPALRGRAWAKLGRALREGVALVPDREQELRCYRRGVALGSLPALCDLGARIYLGPSGQDGDAAAALELLETGLAALSPARAGTLPDNWGYPACLELQLRILLGRPELRTPARVARCRACLVAIGTLASGPGEQDRLAEARERLAQLEAAIAGGR